MKRTLEYLYQNQTLNYSQSKLALESIQSEGVSTEQMASFLTVFNMRGISLEELRAFRDVLKSQALTINLEADQLIDLCGTGGDGKNTFNISTTASFIVAGAGFKVAKHGNYGVSSICGSSSVMESLGYNFTNNEASLNQQLKKANICFLHAPLFHPGMKKIAPVRKALGCSTFFNMLGPLLNPSQLTHQLVGVFSLELQRMYRYLLAESPLNFRVVHDLSGYDEMSLTGKVKLLEKDAEKLIDASAFHMKPLDPCSIEGGANVEEGKAILLSVLANKAPEAHKQVACANAALAIQLLQQCSFEDAFAMATESVESGESLNALKQLLS